MYDYCVLQICQTSILKLTISLEKKLDDYFKTKIAQKTIELLSESYHAEYIRHGNELQKDQDKSNILEKYSFERYYLNISFEAYDMKEELLTDCLYWLDKYFEVRVTNFFIQAQKC